MQIHEYTITNDLADTITSKTAAFVEGDNKIAVPVKALDDQFYGPAESGKDAVAVISGDPAEMTGFLDYFVSSASAAVAPTLTAQYAHINP